jgi:hypothetical protein
MKTSRTSRLKSEQNEHASENWKSDKKGEIQQVNLVKMPSSDISMHNDCQV